VCDVKAVIAVLCDNHIKMVYVITAWLKSCGVDPFMYFRSCVMREVPTVLQD